MRIFIYYLNKLNLWLEANYLRIPLLFIFISHLVYATTFHYFISVLWGLGVLLSILSNWFFPLMLVIGLPAIIVTGVNSADVRLLLFTVPVILVLFFALFVELSNRQKKRRLRWTKFLFLHYIGLTNLGLTLFWLLFPNGFEWDMANLLLMLSIPRSLAAGLLLSGIYVGMRNLSLKKYNAAPVKIVDASLIAVYIALTMLLYTCLAVFGYPAYKGLY